MCNVPNYVFGKVATRSVVRVFLPHMYKMHEKKEVPSKDLALIYNKCLRPLCLELMSNMAAHWPVSYDSALALYKDQSGHIHLGSLDVPSHLLRTFGQRYLEKLKELRPYFRDAYFVHELRGWKAATVHDPTDEPDKVAALEDLTNVLRMDEINLEEWHLDVGVELGYPGHVVTWTKTGHRRVLMHCLPNLDEAEIDALVGQKNFILDRLMHLLDFAGFRCRPGAKGRADNVTYIQAYTTEKTMAYQHHVGLFKERDAQCVLSRESLEKLSKDVEKMSEILSECIGEGGIPHAPQDGCARIEVRARLSDAMDVLSDIPEEIVQECIAAIPAMPYW